MSLNVAPIRFSLHATERKDERFTESLPGLYRSADCHHLALSSIPGDAGKNGGKVLTEHPCFPTHIGVRDFIQNVDVRVVYAASNESTEELVEHRLIGSTEACFLVVSPQQERTQNSQCG